MAYPAVISLKQTITSLLNSDRISFISSTREILQSAFDHTTSLHKLLDHRSERISERLAALNGEIRDCAHQLEDVLEFHELNSQHEEDEEVKKAIASFADTMKKVEVEYSEELSKPVDPQHDNNDDDATASSYIDSDVEMVGNSKTFDEIRKAMLCRIRPHELCFVLLHGEHMEGVKIALDTIFEDPGEGFDCRAWVTVGAEYQLKEILIQIIAQVDSDQDHHDLVEQEEELFNYLCRLLEHRKYMIVLDDVRNVQLVEYLRSSLPNRTDGSIVFLTSSLSKELIPLSDYHALCQMPLQMLKNISLISCGL